MVTATTGTMSFTGLQTKRVYNVSIYISDVVAAAVTFNSNGVAASTSPTVWQIPEDSILTDVSILTGPTVATGMTLSSGYSTIPATNLLIGANLTTLNNRNFPNVGFAKGSLLGATQF
jgi:hypothetical protein